MERKGFRGKVKGMCAAVSVMFMVLTAWLYWKEDAYIKMMTLDISGAQGMFQAEILADGKNVEVICADPGVRLFVDQKQVEGKQRLLIDGEYEEAARDAVSLRVVSDSKDITEKWKYQVLTGREVKEPELTGRINEGRKVYLGAGAIITAFWILYWLLEGKGTKTGRPRLCAEGILDMLKREPGMSQAWEEAAALFSSYWRKRMTTALSVTWLWLLIAFWMVHRTYHGIPFHSQAWLYGGLILGLLALSYRAGKGLNQSLLKLLTKECCPITAAAAFLAAGIYGGGRKRDRFVWFQNGAVGLYRGGYYREALELCRCVWPLPGRRPHAAMAYAHTRLIYLCLKELGQEEEAQKERWRLETLLEENPGLRKREDIQRNLDMDQIREWIAAGEMEQAEAGTQLLLNRCREPYERLPVLGVLAAVKEHLGKEGEAAVLKREILTYSPENMEVRQVAVEGHLTYHSRKAELRDGVGTGIRIVFAVGTGIFFFLLAAPGLKSVPQSDGVVEEETGVALEPTITAAQSLPEPQESQTEDDKNPDGDKEKPEIPDSSQKALIERWDFQSGGISGFSFVCPESWRDLYETEYAAGEYNGISVYQKSSHESMGDGGLFSITVYQDNGYVNLPDYEVWGYEEGNVYVMSRPTDVTFDTKEPKIWEEYSRMAEGIHEIKDSFMIESPDARYDGGEFVFAVSHKVLLEEDHLWNLTPEMLRIARNEIYARHGRRFQDAGLASYFEGCSWYEGVIEPGDFTEDLLNHIERENIKRIQREQERKKEN